MERFLAVIVTAIIGGLNLHYRMVVVGDVFFRIQFY